MTNEITGVISKILEQTTASEKFKKQEIIITTDEKFPQELCVQFVNERINLLKDFGEGSTVKVHFNIKGFKFYNALKDKDAYYINLDAWKIENSEA